jgi:hypothetical protein
VIRTPPANKEKEMPSAFSLAYGLDLDTEIKSFWSWFHDAREVLTETGEGSKQVRDLVKAQREDIERMALTEADPGSARFALSVAVALVGFHYASQQKLLNGLKDYGLLDLPSQARPSVFDTIAEPPFEGPEPPR